jgi:hypothetical protein
MYAFNYTDDKGATQVAVCNNLPDESYGFGIVTPIEVEPMADKVFRGAWEIQGTSLVTGLPKAKLIAHEKRRDERAVLFAPLDIKATIPSEANQAEADRQVIRDADDIKQIDIDDAVDEDILRGVM